MQLAHEQGVCGYIEDEECEMCIDEMDGGIERERMIHEKMMEEVEKDVWPGEEEKWWEKVQKDEGYDSDAVGSRPIKQIWPKDSLLTKDHFTIDEQQCLKCKMKLGYALPMNKDPNPWFLFCTGDNGEQKCQLQADYLPCWSCGNLNTKNTGSVVARPGNCAYYEHPSQIYEFMCYHCHKEMMDNEPGIEECREQLKKIRELRREDKMRGGMGGGGMIGGMRLYERGGGGGVPFSSSLSEGFSGKKRKLESE